MLNYCQSDKVKKTLTRFLVKNYDTADFKARVRSYMKKVAFLQDKFRALEEFKETRIRDLSKMMEREHSKLKHLYSKTQHFPGRDK